MPLPKEKRFRAGPFLYFTANIYDDGGGDAQEEKERIFSLEKKIETLGTWQTTTFKYTADYPC